MNTFPVATSHSQNRVLSITVNDEPHQLKKQPKVQIPLPPPLPPVKCDKTRAIMLLASILQANQARIVGSNRLSLLAAFRCIQLNMVVSLYMELCDEKCVLRFQRALADLNTREKLRAFFSVTNARLRKKTDPGRFVEEKKNLLERAQAKRLERKEKKKDNASRKSVLQNVESTAEVFFCNDDFAINSEKNQSQKKTRRRTRSTSMLPRKPPPQQRRSSDTPAYASDEDILEATGPTVKRKWFAAKLKDVDQQQLSLKKRQQQQQQHVEAFSQCARLYTAWWLAAWHTSAVDVYEALCADAAVHVRAPPPVRAQCVCKRSFIFPGLW